MTYSLTQATHETKIQPNPEKQAAFVDEMLRQFYKQARAQFGDAIRDYWFHDSDLCPACMRRQGGAVKYQGKDALSLNAFIYRERGILIGYFLCTICAGKVLRAAKINPLPTNALARGNRTQFDRRLQPLRQHTHHLTRDAHPPRPLFPR